MEERINMLRLSNLLGNLCKITGAYISLHDEAGYEKYAPGQESSFCSLIRTNTYGHQRCMECDFHIAKETAKAKGKYQYKCHAGLHVHALPIVQDQKIAAFVYYGRSLDEASLAEQWKATRRACGWYPNLDILEEAFALLPQMDLDQFEACYYIICAFISQVRLENILGKDPKTEREMLIAYIKANYTEPLTAEKIANALSVSKSKLYMIASGIEEELTINQMITNYRMQEAKKMLKKPGISIRDIAEMVGIRDYNYFTKVFKKATGKTPSQYRKELEGGEKNN